MCWSCNQPKGEKDEKILEAQEKANQTGQWFAIDFEGNIITADRAFQIGIPCQQYISPNVRYTNSVEVFQDQIGQRS